MPYSVKSKYKHNRQKPPSNFEKGTLKTVPLSHTSYSGKKFKVNGAKAIIGRLKSVNRTRGKSGNRVSWAIQSILIPK